MRLYFECCLLLLGIYNSSIHKIYYYGGWVWEFFLSNELMYEEYILCINFTYLSNNLWHKTVFCVTCIVDIEWPEL